MGHTLTRGHPVLVAPQRVDLAVVAHEAVGLRPVPTGERIRREPRVDHGQVRLVVRLPQVRIERHQLAGREHPLVDEHLGGEAGDVERLALAHPAVGSKQVAGALADQVEPSLEGIAAQPVAGCDEYLLDGGRCSQRGGADPRFPRVGRHRPPAHQKLAFLGADSSHCPFAFLPLRGVVGEKDDPCGELAGLRQVPAEFFAGDPGEKFVGERGQDSGAVSSGFLRAAGTAVVHPAQQVFGVGNDFMAALSLDMGHKADATALVLPFGRVQAMCRRKAARRPDVLFPIHSSPVRVNAPSNCCAAFRPQRSPGGRIAYFTHSAWRAFSAGESKRSGSIPVASEPVSSPDTGVLGPSRAAIIAPTIPSLFGNVSGMDEWPGANDSARESDSSPGERFEAGRKAGRRPDFA